MFRLVELNRLTLQTRQEEEREFASLGRKDPDRVIRLPSENRGGVREVYTKVGLSYTFFWKDICVLQICDNCGEEFCYGACMKFQYEESRRNQKMENIKKQMGTPPTCSDEKDFEKD